MLLSPTQLHAGEVGVGALSRQVWTLQVRVAGLSGFRIILTNLLTHITGS